MESLKEIFAKQQQASPGYFADPEKSRMVATILSLAEEVCVLRDRLDTCRRLAEEGKPASRDNIESFDVTDTLQEQRLRAHTDFFQATLAKLLD